MFLFVLAVVYVWGSLVTVNAAFTACAGVYGRWYFDKDSGAPVSTSLREAWSTSFGSICYGSFIVALVRAVQFVVKSLRQEAARDQNYVLCVLLCIVECMIDCVGDILEFVSEMAYVQCAVRGLGFCQACAATPLGILLTVSELPASPHPEHCQSPMPASRPCAARRPSEIRGSHPRHGRSRGIRRRS